MQGITLTIKLGWGAVVIFTAVALNLAQETKTASLKELNQKTVEAYKIGNLDEAAKYAKQAVEQSLKANGENHIDSAVAYVNLAVVQRERKKFAESVAGFQKAYDIYQSIAPNNAKKTFESLQNLALAQTLANKKTEAEANYLKLWNFSSVKFGDTSRETYRAILDLANFYARIKEDEKADSHYLKAYKLALKLFGEESEEFKLVSDSRLCLVDEPFSSKREKEFDSQYDALFVNKAGSGYANIINGKALNLIKPPYPAEAKKQRLTGTTKIKVTIDEKGDVKSAKSACGDGILERASEAAALKSKFSPTVADGKAVEVSGVIIYNFRAY